VYNYVFSKKNTFVNVQLHLNHNIIVYHTFMYVPPEFFDQLSFEQQSSKRKNTELVKFIGKNK
jgi:hypothetical protein